MVFDDSPFPTPFLFLSCSSINPYSFLLLYIFVPDSYVMYSNRGQRSHLRLYSSHLFSFLLSFSFSSLLSCRLYLLFCMVRHSIIPGSGLEQGVWSGMDSLLDI